MVWSGGLGQGADDGLHIQGLGRENDAGEEDLVPVRCIYTEPRWATHPNFM